MRELRSRARLPAARAARAGLSDRNGTPRSASASASCAGVSPRPGCALSTSSTAVVRAPRPAAVAGRASGALRTDGSGSLVTSLEPPRRSSARIASSISLRRERSVKSAASIAGSGMPLTYKVRVGPSTRIRRSVTTVNGSSAPAQPEPPTHGVPRASSSPRVLYRPSAHHVVLARRQAGPSPAETRARRAALPQSPPASTDARGCSSPADACASGQARDAA